LKALPHEQEEGGTLAIVVAGARAEASLPTVYLVVGTHELHRFEKKSKQATTFAPAKTRNMVL